MDRKTKFRFALAYIQRHSRLSILDRVLRSYYQDLYSTIYHNIKDFKTKGSEKDPKIGLAENLQVTILDRERSNPGRSKITNI